MTQVTLGHTGLYEAMEQARVRFIGITNHRLAVAREVVATGYTRRPSFPSTIWPLRKKLHWWRHTGLGTWVLSP